MDGKRQLGNSQAIETARFSQNQFWGLGQTNLYFIYNFLQLAVPLVSLFLGDAGRRPEPRVCLHQWPWPLREKTAMVTLHRR
jgi:hypothetical protein